MRIEGPAIIEEKTSTTVLYPGQHAEVDEYLNIEIAVPGRAGQNARTHRALRRNDYGHA